MSLRGQLKLLRAEKVGLPKLTFQIWVKNNFGASLTVLGVHAEVRAAANGYRYDLMNSSCFVGHAHLDDAPGQISTGGEAIWTLSLPITHYCLQEVEKIRKGRDLMLMAAVRFVAAIAEPNDAARYGRFVSGRVDNETSADAYCTARIPKSDWINWLKAFGYGDFYLIEVPLRGVPERSELKKALGHLTAAWDHFGQGNDSEALGSCYKSFERLALDLGARQPDQNGWEKILNGVDQPKREKLKHLLRYLCDYLHLGRHEQKGDSVELNRFDAEYAVIMTQATLAYLAKLWSTRRSALADKSAAASPQPGIPTLPGVSGFERP